MPETIGSGSGRVRTVGACRFDAIRRPHCRWRRRRCRRYRPVRSFIMFRDCMSTDNSDHSVMHNRVHTYRHESDRIRRRQRLVVEFVALHRRRRRHGRRQRRQNVDTIGITTTATAGTGSGMLGIEPATAHGGGRCRRRPDVCGGVAMAFATVVGVGAARRCALERNRSANVAVVGRGSLADGDSGPTAAS